VLSFILCSLVTAEDNHDPKDFLPDEVIKQMESGKAPS